MGAIVAVLSKYGRNVVPEAIKMLKILKHRGSDAYGISDGKKIIVTKNLKEITYVDMKSSVVLGYNFRRIFPSDCPQPIDGKSFKIVFDGRIFPPHSMSDVIDFIERSSNNVGDSAKNIVETLDGAFAFAILKDDKLIVGRDPVGAVPLYLGENEQIYALTSERKALWAIGIKDDYIKSFPPGNIAEISDGNIKLKPIKTIGLTLVKNFNEKEVLGKLYSLLSNSIMKRTLDADKISIAFSGGVDSNILAALVKELGVKAFLIYVGLEGSKELNQAEEAAEKIGLPFQAELYTPEDVKESARKVLWLIESADALRVAIGIPIFWAAETSAKMGCKVMLLGQGSDEIFAGYYRYLGDYKKSKEYVERIIYHDALNLHEKSLEPAEKICSFHGIEVRFPYADYDLMAFAVNLPITLKIIGENDLLRKRILRRLAEHIGLPPELCWRPKKAIQYGTKVNEVLKKMGRKMGLSMKNFVEHMFEEIKWFNKDENYASNI